MKKITVLALALLIGASSCSNNNADTAETTEAAEVAAVEGDAYGVELASSEVEWKGFHKGGFAPRWGAIKLSEGEVYVKDNNIVAGKFTIDFNTLTVDPASVTEEGKNYADLEGHLKSPEFFNIEQFPTGTFEITGVADFDAATQTSVLEGANKWVSGNLTLQGNTLNISFPAKIVVADGTAKVDAKFLVDRTSWNIKYGTEEANPADWGISKDIEIGINLTAVAK